LVEKPARKASLRRPCIRGGPRKGSPAQRS